MNISLRKPIIGHRLIQGDAKSALSEIEDESVSLVVTSPPYNINKEYELQEFQSLSDYIKSFDVIIDQLIAKLKPQGSICWQVGNYVDRGEVIPLDVIFL